MGSPPPPPPKPHAPKSMISAGRDVLRRAAGASTEEDEGEDGGAQSTALAVPNQYDGLYWRDLVQSSARKRERLRGKLTEDGDRAAVASSSSSSLGALVPRRLGGAMTAIIGDVKDDRDPEKYTIDTGLVKRVSELLKESGRRLKLGRNWWISSSASPRKDGKGADSKGEEEEEAKLENQGAEGLEGIVRSYCRSVEDRVSRVGEDLKEMRAFCEYLEAKVLAASLSTSTVTP